MTDAVERDEREGQLPQWAQVKISLLRTRLAVLDSAAAGGGALLKEAVKALENYVDPNSASSSSYVDGLINRIRRSLKQEGGR